MTAIAAPHRSISWAQYVIPGIAHLLSYARGMYDVPPIACLHYVLAELNVSHRSIPRLLLLNRATDGAQMLAECVGGVSRASSQILINPKLLTSDR